MDRGRVGAPRVVGFEVAGHVEAVRERVLEPGGSVQPLLGAPVGVETPLELGSDRVAARRALKANWASIRGRRTFREWAITGEMDPGTRVTTEVDRDGVARAGFESGDTGSRALLEAHVGVVAVPWWLCNEARGEAGAPDR